MFPRPYISIPYLSPLLVVLLFVCSPTYLCFNIADHQICGPLGGHWHIFLQDIHVLALHGPNGWKVIIVKNWNGFWHGQVLIIQITLGHFFLHGASCSSWCRRKFNLFMFYLYIIFFINLKDACVNVMYGNAQVLDEELNLLWLGFLGMLFYILLEFHINLINCKSCIQHKLPFFY